ncbi:hypothetical protein WA538_002644 [Blastocystis sp. DL]
MESFVSIEIEGLGEDFTWSESEYQIRDLNTSHPILQINDKTLIGQYEMTDGSEVILSPDGKVHLSNKKLVFRLRAEYPDYEAILMASAAIRNGDSTANGFIN